MQTTKAGRVRHVLVSVVAKSHDSIVSPQALEDDDLFKNFLEKEINLEFATFDELDFEDVLDEVGERLNIVVPDRSYATWRTLFDQINLILY